MTEIMPPKLKKGAISNKELEYIASHYERATPEHLAEILNRSVEFINKAIAQLPARQEVESHSSAVEQMHASPLWTEMKAILLPSEYDGFDNKWASCIKQFCDNGIVVASDEMMIKDLIILDIFGARAAAEKKSAMMLMDTLQKLIDEERKHDVANRDQVSLQNWQEQVNAIRASTKALTDTHINYQERKDQKLKQLKATREARFKEDVESHENIFGLFRKLNEIRSRQREGNLNEKVRIAALKVKDDWNELNEYDDGTVDKPFLSPEGELEDESRLHNEQESDKQE